METMLNFRGERIPTIKDMVDIQTYIVWSITGRLGPLVQASDE